MPSGERATREYSNLSHAQSKPQRSHLLTLTLFTLLLLCAPTILSGVLDRQVVASSAARPVSAGVRKAERSQDNKALQLTTQCDILHSTSMYNCTLAGGTTRHSKDPGQARQPRSTLKAITAVPEYRYPKTAPNNTARSQPEDNTRTCQQREPCQGTEHRLKRPRHTVKTGASSNILGQQTDTIAADKWQGDYAQHQTFWNMTSPSRKHEAIVQPEAHQGHQHCTAFSAPQRLVLPSKAYKHTNRQAEQPVGKDQHIAHVFAHALSTNMALPPITTAQLVEDITCAGNILLHILHRIMLMLFTTCHTVLPIMITSTWLTMSVYATAMHMHQAGSKPKSPIQSMLRFLLLQHCIVYMIRIRCFVCMVSMQIAASRIGYITLAYSYL